MKTKERFLKEYKINLHMYKGKKKSLILKFIFFYVKGQIFLLRFFIIFFLNTQFYSQFVHSPWFSMFKNQIFVLKSVVLELGIDERFNNGQQYANYELVSVNVNQFLIVLKTKLSEPKNWKMHVFINLWKFKTFYMLLTART